jgi:crotonobetainyl-CoA:carnitine CoA-transferase CaiB-like acyl-CoA transferase
MQHHGVPTRLLDWSDGALIALHFAIARKQRPPRSGAIIYVFDPDWLLKTLEQDEDREDAEARWKLYAEKDKTVEDDDWPRLYLPADDDDFKDRLLDTPAIPMLWDSPHFTRRIAAQRSRFMIFGSDPLWLAKLARQASSRIASIGIPVGAINKMKLELRDAGITESVVFPDLDGLGRELKQIWEMRR